MAANRSTQKARTIAEEHLRQEQLCPAEWVLSLLVEDQDGTLSSVEIKRGSLRDVLYTAREIKGNSIFPLRARPS